MSSSSTTRTRTDCRTAARAWALSPSRASRAAPRGTSPCRGPRPRPGSIGCACKRAPRPAPPPATPVAACAIAPLAPSETSVRFAAAWTAPATPGTYDVVADVDFGDDLAEGDEANNRFTWTIDVLAGPLTTLVV